MSQSAISEQVADLERELGGALLERGSRSTRLTVQGRTFLVEARKILAAAERAVDVTQRSILGLEGTLAIGFFLWGAGGFFPQIIREYRNLYPNIKLSLFEMHAPVQMEALMSGKIDVGFTRPLEPPFDRSLKAELLYQDPAVVVLPREHPLAGGTVRMESLSGESFVMCDRTVTPVLFESIVGLCAKAGFSPRIVNSSTTWSGVITLVEAGEGIALVPSGVRYMLPPALVFCDVVPETAHVGLSIAWNPLHEGPIQQAFLRLVQENKSGFRATAAARP